MSPEYALDHANRMLAIATQAARQRNWWYVRTGAKLAVQVMDEAVQTARERGA